MKEKLQYKLLLFYINIYIIYFDPINNIMLKKIKFQTYKNHNQHIK